MEITASTVREITFRSSTLSKNTLAVYITTVRQYLKFIDCKGLKPDSESLIKYKKEALGQYAPATYNLKVQALKEFFLGLYRSDYHKCYGIEKFFQAEFPRITLKKSVTRERFIDKAKLDTLCQQLEAEQKNGTTNIALIIQALFWSGLRVSELLSIKLGGIELENVAILKVVGKGKKQHKAYLPLQLYSKIREHFGSTEYLFETRNGHPFHRCTVTRQIKEKCSKYGVCLSAHEIGRHSRAMHLKSIGLSADKVAKALNHSSVKTTIENYFHGEPTIEEMGLVE